MLRTTLAEMGWNQNTLARIIGRPVAMVCEVVNGKKSITAETAWQFEAAGLGDAIYWLTLQAAHEVRSGKPKGLGLVRRRALVERNRRRGRPPLHTAVAKKTKPVRPRS
jgi:HTH-type transcriptional regulator/antitoxin HigA